MNKYQLIFSQNLTLKLSNKTIYIEHGIQNFENRKRNIQCEDNGNCGIEMKSMWNIMKELSGKFCQEQIQKKGQGKDTALLTVYFPCL